MENHGLDIQTICNDKGTAYASREIEDFLKVNVRAHYPTGHAEHTKMKV